jgi:hypothetical protein
MNSELDLFSTRGYQAELFGAEYKTIRPHATLKDSGPLQFMMTDSREYYDLSETILCLKAKITGADGGVIPTTQGKDDVALVNNAMHSIFSDVQVLLNGKPVEGVPDGFYPYRAYIHNLLTYTKDAQQHQLFAQGWVRDDHAAMDAATNSGFIARKAWNVVGTEKTFYGKLLSGVFQQNRLLVPGTDFGLILHRAQDSFAILNTNNLIKPKVVITEASLQMLAVKVNPAILQQQATALVRGIPAIYEFNKVDFSNIACAAKETNVQKAKLFNMRVPKYLVMFMVPNSAFHGDYTKNPFNFKHYNMKSLQLTRDDENVPFERFEPDFQTGDVLREYMSQYQSNGLLGKNAILPITYDEFKNGYTIFQWNLSDNRRGVNAGPYQHGNLEVKVAFTEPLPEAMVMVFYGIFESTVEVFGNDHVIVDGV